MSSNFVLCSFLSFDIILYTKCVHGSVNGGLIKKSVV